MHAYCRVNKDIEEQESSFNTQMEAYGRIISEHPEWELVEIYADKGKTGTNTKQRTEFKRMMHDAEDGKIDIVNNTNFNQRESKNCLVLIIKEPH